jgi:small multidrug resistance family-3 protein
MCCDTAHDGRPIHRPVRRRRTRRDRRRLARLARHPEHKGLLWIGAGIAAIGAYGFVPTFQPDPNFGRTLAAYGGVFVAGSLAWGMVIDGFRPDRWNIIGAMICLLGVAMIMYAPRSS